jgi:uncharacterized protein YdaU (DUF1376 family)
MSDAKTDIWMPLYVGDFLADTSHLDAERSGCYMLWLMHYWRKGPLTANVTDLVGIGKLRSNDAPSIAQALLVEFFKLEDDGLYHQKRSDREIAKWQSKRLKAKEKASIAAQTRWGSNAPSNAPSNQQAMLGSCPSPSPSPSHKEQIPSRAKIARAAKGDSSETDPTKTDLARARHAEFKAILGKYWESVNGDLPMTWDGSEGKNLEMWLKANPLVTAVQFRRMLYNRSKSDVPQSERPSEWIRSITKYAGSPLDGYGKPKGAATLVNPEKTRYQIEADEQIAEQRRLREQLSRGEQIQ